MPPPSPEQDLRDAQLHAEATLEPRQLPTMVDWMVTLVVFFGITAMAFGVFMIAALGIREGLSADHGADSGLPGALPLLIIASIGIGLVATWLWRSRSA